MAEWYTHTCGDCLYLDPNERNRYDNSKAYCSERCEYVEINSRACSNYFCYDDKKSSTSGGSCYLTTIMVNVLGQPDNNKYLDTMRKFRDETLLGCPDYLPLLWEYDTVGPMISEAIENDPCKETISKKYFKDYIEPIVGMLETGLPLSAISKYQEMVYSLKEFYKIEPVEYDDSFRVTGKGYLKR